MNHSLRVTNATRLYASGVHEQLVNHGWEKGPPRDDTMVFMNVAFYSGSEHRALRLKSLLKEWTITKTSIDGIPFQRMNHIIMVQCVWLVSQWLTVIVSIGGMVSSLCICRQFLHSYQTLLQSLGMLLLFALQLLYHAFLGATNLVLMTIICSVGLGTADMH